MNSEEGNSPYPQPTKKKKVTQKQTKTRRTNQRRTFSMTAPLTNRLRKETATRASRTAASSGTRTPRGRKETKAALTESPTTTLLGPRRTSGIRRTTKRKQKPGAASNPGKEPQGPRQQGQT